jgi:hypothetical protein
MPQQTDVYGALNYRNDSLGGVDNPQCDFIEHAGVKIYHAKGYATVTKEKATALPVYCSEWKPAGDETWRPTKMKLPANARIIRNDVIISLEDFDTLIADSGDTLHAHYQTNAQNTKVTVSVPATSAGTSVPFLTYKEGNYKPSAAYNLQELGSDTAISVGTAAVDFSLYSASTSGVRLHADSKHDEVQIGCSVKFYLPSDAPSFKDVVYF